MGQKVHPEGIRLGIVKTWSSTWYAERENYAANIYNDHQVREFLKKELKKAFVSKITIERPAKSILVTIYTARPGIVIEKKGEDIDKLRNKISKLTGLSAQINIYEERRPEIVSSLVAASIASQLERRVMFRRAMKKAIDSAMRFGAKGIKIKVSGRLGGAEIARYEWYHKGRVPLHTLRADIDYATSTAYTTYGVIGIKVWIFKGEILDGMPLLHSKKRRK